ncbi:MAG: DUF2157 domain-containing protein [Gammaproteobacteria bacterium]|nr:DUF2157 domain-containing protein [Gammaproteobacteria bacterium]
MSLLSNPGLSKFAAQKRADQVKAFQDELALLKGDGVLSLTEEQAQSVHAYHQTLLSQYSDDFDIDQDQREKQLSLGMRIASFLGALALAASVFFLFYQFWGKLSTTSQVAILIAGTLATFIATLLVAEREKTGYFAKLVGLVSFACFVLNISMLGQMFNITPSDNAFIVWGAFAFLLAYTCDIRLLQAAGILCVIGFVSARVGTWSGMYWLSFGERPENFFPAAILLFLFPQWVNHARYWGFAPLYRVFGLLSLFLPILVLSNYGRISYLAVDTEVIEGLYQLAGFVLSAAAVWWGIRKHWKDTINTGNVFFVIFLYTKFFDWWWEIMPKYLFFFVIGLTAVLFLLVFKRLRAKGFFDFTEARQ